MSATGAGADEQQGRREAVTIGQREAGDPRETHMAHQSRILGHRIDGRPFHGFSGAADDGGDDGGGGDGGTGNQPDPNAIDSNGLTEAGRTAIANERNATKAAKGEVRNWKAMAAEFGFTTLDQVKEALSKAKEAPAGAQQQQVDVEALRREAEQKAQTAADRRVARAEVKALAAVSFADPEDAVSALSDEDVDDLLGRNGAIDTEAAKRALADVLRRKPHWAKPTEERPPNYDGGSRSNSGGGPATAGDFLRDQVSAARRR